MQRGWIKVWRRLQDDEIWINPEPFNKRDAWIDLLLMTWAKDKDFLIGKKVVKLKPGQIFLSYRFLCSKWHWSRHKLSDYLNLLKNLDKISFVCSKTGTLITILRWETYQGIFNDEGTQPAPIKGHKRDTKGTKQRSKEVEKVKEVKDPLVELFNSTCSSLSKVGDLSQTRKGKIKTRLKEHPDLGWWKEVFIRADEILIEGKKGRKDWRPSFDWLIENDNNAIKVSEGNYDDKTRSWRDKYKGDRS